MEIWAALRHNNKDHNLYMQISEVYPENWIINIPRSIQAYSD